MVLLNYLLDFSRLGEVGDVPPRLALQQLVGLAFRHVQHQVSLLEVAQHSQQQHRVVVPTFADGQVVAKPPADVDRAEVTGVENKTGVAVDRRQNDQH